MDNTLHGRVILMEVSTGVTKRPSEKINETNSTVFDAWIYLNPVRGDATLQIRGNVIDMTIVITNINGQTL